MRIRREYWWVAGVVALALVIAIFSWVRSTKPYGRPAPSSKWTSATTEPDLRVFMADTGSIQTMKFEKYIEGVVAQEMDPNWPLEALKAQAIVVRTFTIEELDRRGGVQNLHPGADVSTNPEEFQAYSASRVNDNVRRAVQETRGLIMTYGNRPARAWFHADAGGQTATPQEGLGPAAGPNPPYLPSVKVPWTAPDTDWTATFSRSELRAAASKAGRDPGNFTTVSIGRKGPSGRALEIMLGNTAVPAPGLRLALGSTRMKSTLLLSLTMDGDRVTMKGRGSGHGVGLPQWAAKLMAEQGRSATDIVKYFYRGVSVAKLWP